MGLRLDFDGRWRRVAANRQHFVLGVMLFTPVMLGVLWFVEGAGYLIGRYLAPREGKTAGKAAP